MMTSKQIKCLELMVSGEFTQKQIADRVKVSEQTICNWKKDAAFMQEHDRLIRAGLQSVAAKAFQKQVKLLDARNEMVQYMAAKDILDRAGFKPEDNVKINGVIPVVISGSDDLED